MSERLARFMFDLQADDYDAQGAMRELAWAERNARGFWLGRANAVASFLRLEAAWAALPLHDVLSIVAWAGSM
jgi:hypothetical protein